MKKTLKLIMAIVLFIAVIAIANCVSAATVNLGDIDAELTADGSATVYKIKNDEIADMAGKDIAITSEYNGAVLDLNKASVGTITVYANNVDIVNGTASDVEVRGSLVLNEKHGAGLVVSNGTVNYGTIEIGKGRSMGTVENLGTITVEEKVSKLIMKSGNADVKGTVASLEVEGGSVVLDEDSTFTITSFKAGRIESGKSLAANDNFITDKENYILVINRGKNGESDKYYVAPKSELKVSVTFTDKATGRNVTTLKAGEEYDVSAEILYNGVAVTTNAEGWSNNPTFKITSANKDILMPVENAKSFVFKAMKDGTATLEVENVGGSDKAYRVKRTINVTVGEVKNDEPEQEPEGNQPSENKGELDSTPKTGDYIEMAAAILVVGKGEKRN